MGQRDYFDKKPTLGQNNNALIILFGINAFVFVLLQFIYIVYKIDLTKEVAESLFRSKVLYWFSISPQAHHLVVKSWTLITYMFSHYSVIGFISNMLWLWAFGYILQDLVGNKKLIPVYLYGGFASAVFFIFSASYIPAVAHTIHKYFLYEGGNAAIIAVAVATTKLSPRYRIFQHIGEGFPLWILTTIFLLTDIVFLYNTNLAVVISHIAAALMGYIYIVQLQNGNDWGAWMYSIVNKIDELFNPEKKYKKQDSSKMHFYNQTVDAFQKTENLTEKKLNEILDKINSKGYNSLSNSEKDFLDRASKQ